MSQNQNVKDERGSAPAPGSPGKDFCRRSGIPEQINESVPVDTSTDVPDVLETSNIQAVEQSGSRTSTDVDINSESSELAPLSEGGDESDVGSSPEGPLSQGEEDNDVGSSPEGPCSQGEEETDVGSSPEGAEGPIAGGSKHISFNQINNIRGRKRKGVNPSENTCDFQHPESEQENDDDCSGVNLPFVLLLNMNDKLEQNQKKLFDQGDIFKQILRDQQMKIVHQDWEINRLRGLIWLSFFIIFVFVVVMYFLLIQSHF